MGGANGGAEEVKSHEFFTSINWKCLFEKEIDPEFVPNIKDDLGTNYVDEELAEENAEYSSDSTSSLSALSFNDFTFDPESPSLLYKTSPVLIPKDSPMFLPSSCRFSSIELKLN